MITIFSKAADICLSVLIRLVFLVQIVFSIYFMVAFYNEYIYFGLSIGAIAIVCDGTYVAVARKGKEFKWFSISSFVYSTVILILIWHLVFLKMESYKDNFCPSDERFNRLTTKYALEDFWIFKRLDVCQLMEVVISAFILTNLMARWAYPIKKKKIANEAFLHIFIGYITSGSDIIDLFGYVDDTDVVFSFGFNVAIMTFSSLSVFQYSFDLSARMNTSQHREPKYDLTKKRTSLTNMCRLVFGTEIWSLLFVFVVQELPFTVLRLVVMVHYQHLSKNYTLYFFVIKNLVLSACELYYIGVILVHHVKKYQKEKKQQEIIA